MPQDDPRDPQTGDGGARPGADRDSGVNPGRVDLIGQAQAWERERRDTDTPPPFDPATFTRQDGLDAHAALERLRAISRFWRRLRRWLMKLAGSLTIAFIITGPFPWMIDIWHRLKAASAAFFR